MHDLLVLDFRKLSIALTFPSTMLKKYLPLVKELFYLILLMNMSLVIRQTNPFLPMRAMIPLKGVVGTIVSVLDKEMT